MPLFTVITVSETVHEVEATGVVEAVALARGSIGGDTRVLSASVMDAEADPATSGSAVFMEETDGAGGPLKLRQGLLRPAEGGRVQASFYDGTSLVADFVATPGTNLGLILPGIIMAWKKGLLRI